MNQGIFSFNSNSLVSMPYAFNAPNPAIIRVKFLIVAGGGGGTNGSSSAGGAAGGAGGYLEDVCYVSLGVNYPISVGAGAPRNSSRTIGSNSNFGQIIAIGGGQYDITYSSPIPGGSGASSSGVLRGLCISNLQGNNGGLGYSNTIGGGGGGAGGVGSNASAGVAGAGGVGRLSVTTLQPSYFAGGGGGGVTSGGVRGVGGSSVVGGITIGGNGGNGTIVASDGGVNTGGGGGGGGASATPSLALGGNGGSGIVVLRFDSNYKINVGAGLSYTINSSGSEKILTFTSGSDNVSFV
jgi:hypothetical protein